MQFTPEHLETAVALSKLARFARTQHQNERAQHLFQRALAIYEKHPEELSSHAVTLNNFAVLFLDQEKPTHAEPLLRRFIHNFGETVPTCYHFHTELREHYNA